MAPPPGVLRHAHHALNLLVGHNTRSLLSLSFCWWSCFGLLAPMALQLVSPWDGLRTLQALGVLATVAHAVRWRLGSLLGSPSGVWGSRGSLGTLVFTTSQLLLDLSGCIVQRESLTIIPLATKIFVQGGLVLVTFY